MSRIVVSGAAGRMGQAILRISAERGHDIHAAFEYAGSPEMGASVGSRLQRDDIETIIQPMSPAALEGSDVIIDFTSPEATLALLAEAVTAKKPMVIGTTGFTDKQKLRIEEAANIIPLLFSPNMSVGVNLLFKLTELATKILNNGYDIEVFEAHHRHKKDAPSGTAKKLVDIIKSATPELGGSDEVYGRSGITGERSNNEIGVMAMRGGDIVGEHTVFYIGEGERIELTHRATSRDILARGAVLGLEFIVRRPPGLYTMFDVLGF